MAKKKTDPTSREIISFDKSINRIGEGGETIRREERNKETKKYTYIEIREKSYKKRLL